MRKRLAYIIVAVLIAAVLVGVAWLAPRQADDPVYDGKPLSLWLEGYQLPKKQYEREWAQVDEAVRHMGTNAIPMLLAMMRLSDSAPWKRKVLDLAYRQHLINLNHTHAWAQNWRAANAFGALGKDAAGAVPDLIELYENPISSPSRRYTAVALGRIGPAARPAIPSLLRAVNNSSEEEVTAYAIIAIGGIHAEPELVVPVLAKCLGSGSTEIQMEAVDALGDFGADAKAAVPILIELLQSTNQVIASHVRTALPRIDPEAANQAAVK